MSFLSDFLETAELVKDVLTLEEPQPIDYRAVKQLSSHLEELQASCEEFLGNYESNNEDYWL